MCSAPRSSWEASPRPSPHHRQPRTVQGKKKNLAKPGKAPLSTPAGDAFRTYEAWWVDANTIKFSLDDEYRFTLHRSTN